MMRRLLGLSLALALVACAQDRSSPPTSPAPAATGGQGLAPSADGDYVAGQILVRFRPGAPSAALLEPHRASIRREVLFGVEMVDVPKGSERAIAAALQHSPWVEFAEPDYLRTYGTPCASPDGDCTAPNDTYLGYKWDLHNDGTINTPAGTQLAVTAKVDADIDWLEAYDQIGTLTGAARIGIIDTGIMANHPDLIGKVVAGFDFFNDDPDPTDDDGHGTHVAGIAAAHGHNGVGVMGVAWGPNITLVAAKVCGSIGCPSSDVAAGIQFAVANGAHVLNISLGGPFASNTERLALQYARASNVLPFCAAGNGGGAVSYPAAFPECVAVSATDWGDKLASYSNFGPPIELAAPGGDFEHGSGYSYILSTHGHATVQEGGGIAIVMNYLFMAGTSMATPQVSGLAALLHAQGVIDDDAKLARMKATANDLGAPGVDTQFGSGRINVFAAINGIGPPPPPPPPSSTIVLLATKRVEGRRNFADLTWTGAVGLQVEVYRNSSLRTTTANDGAFSDNLGRRARGTFTYEVCEVGGLICSNEASVTF
jgi:serine protease